MMICVVLLCIKLLTAVCHSVFFLPFACASLGCFSSVLSAQSRSGCIDQPVEPENVATAVVQQENALAHKPS